MEVATQNEKVEIEMMRNRCNVVKNLMSRIAEDAQIEIDRRRPVRRNGDIRENQARLDPQNEARDLRDREVRASSGEIYEEAEIVEQSLTAISRLGNMEYNEERRAEFVRKLAENRQDMEDIEVMIIRLRRHIII